jgi:hypothetical protein
MAAVIFPAPGFNDLSAARSNLFYAPDNYSIKMGRKAVEFS